MSDHLPDSQYMATTYCPTCEPTRDPVAEILETRHCEYHQPMRSGDADGTVLAASYLSGNADAGGDSNAAWCDLIHRKKALLRGPA